MSEDRAAGARKERVDAKSPARPMAGATESTLPDLGMKARAAYNLKSPLRVRAGKVLGLLVILLAVFAFCFRGPKRALRDSGDFAAVYGAARSWLVHISPYRQININRQYAAGNGDWRRAPNPGIRAAIYAPSVFPLVSTVAFLDWEVAKRLWMILSVASFAASLVCGLRSAIVPRPNLVQALLVLFLLFSPVQSGIAQGQPSVICISLLVCAFHLRQSSSKQKLLSGLLLGISCCIKPNIALPYILFCCWRRQWRVAGTSMAVVLAVSGVAVASLMAFSPGWWGEWFNNLKVASAAGGNMDPTIASPTSHLLVNFQTVIGFFTTDRTLCDAVTYVLLAALALWVIRRVKSPPDEWSLLALFSTFVLLGSYHRYYDVQLLMLGTNAALQLYTRRGGLPVLAGLAVPGLLLWFPFQALAGLHLRGPGPAAAEPLSRLALQFLEFRNQPLSLLAFAIVFAWAMAKRPAKAMAG